MSSGNGKVAITMPPWGDRLVWNGKEFVPLEVPVGFPILTGRSKLQVFAWSTFFIVDAALVALMVYRIYRLLRRE